MDLFEFLVIAWAVCSCVALLAVFKDMEGV